MAEPVPNPKPVIGIPVCICGSPLRLTTSNRSETQQTGKPDDSLVTVKWNFRCFDCHATVVVQLDNGDDPRGYTER